MATRMATFAAVLSILQFERVKQCIKTRMIILAMW